MDKKRVLIWGGFIIGITALLFGLAKLGATQPAGVAGNALTVPVSAADWSQGSTTAPHTLVEYSDFQCPSCATIEPLLKQLVKDHGQQVRLVYRHFPLEAIHQNSRIAAWAAEAAGKQGKFWEMSSALFNTQSTWGTDANPNIFFEDLAYSVGLNTDQFKKDLKDQTLNDKVGAQIAGGKSAGINATPSLFLDGILINLPANYEELVRLVTTSTTQK